MREPQPRIEAALTNLVPYAFLVAAVGAVSFLVLQKRVDLAARSLYLLIPLAAASLIVLARPGWFARSSLGSLPRIRLSLVSFRHLVLLFAALYLASLSLLAQSEVSPPAYFIIIAVTAAIIFAEILACGEEQPGRKGIILTQIVFLSANLIFGQTLRLPLFFGYGDVLPHMYNIDTILETGQITSGMLVDYQYFPAFHVFGAIGNMLGGTELETSFFLFNGLFFLVSIPVVYLLVSKVTKNNHLPLTAALLYAVSREAIFNGMYMITRVMAFILCLVILYLLIRGRTSLKLRALALFLILPLVLTHHTTMLHFAGVLFFLVAAEFVLYRSEWAIGLNFLVFFIVAFLGYWLIFAFPFLQKALIDYSSTNDISQVVLPDTEGSLLFTFTNNADGIVIAFLAVLGMISLLRARHESATMGTAFALFGGAALVLYFPGISSFLSKMLLASRLQLLVSPFVIFVTAGGLMLIAGKKRVTRWRWKSKARVSLSLAIVFFLTLSATVIQANYNELNLANVLGSENRQYFTRSELAGFSFVDRHGRNLTYFGDYASSTYLWERLGLSVRQNMDVFEPGSITSGALAFRKQELESRGRLSFTIWDEQDQEYVYRPGTENDLQAKWELENKTYDSGSLYIYIKKVPEAGDSGD